MSEGFWIVIAIFIATYAVIMSERIHRTVAAIAGAALLILLGFLQQKAAIEAIDFNTLGLLIGLMVIVGIAKDSGMFQFVAIWAAKVARGKPVPIFLILGLITAVFSAFLDNVTTVLLMVPVVFVIARQLRMDPKMFLISTILLANIGGVATLIGDPPNILIGSAAGISFIDFLIHLGPISLLLTMVTLGLFFLMQRKGFKTNPEAQKAICSFRPKEAITDWPLLWKSLAVLLLLVLGFFTHTITHLEAATIALSAAALLLLLTMRDPEHHLRDVEWTTIFFFIGLFVLVHGLEEIGLIHSMAEGLLHMTGGNLALTTLGILWGSAILSAIIDNIPFVATMIPLVKEFGVLSDITLGPLWWALALGADIGGNATIIGASANLTVAGMAEKEGHKIGFVEYMKISVPLTFIALVISSVYLYLRYLV